MPPEPGFKSDAQRRKFEAANRDHRRGGPKARVCGAHLPGNKICGAIPLKGEKRCLRHCGPAAARRHRDRQLAGMRTGRVSPAEFARAEARRARNALTDRWKIDQRVPGETIDLGPNEWLFREAAERRDVDLAALLPAVADWLRWQWQRLQIDRRADGRWMRLCREELPRRIAAAKKAAAWASLGGYSRASKAGRLLARVLAQDGHEAARDLVNEWQAEGINPPPKRRWRPLTHLPVRPWAATDPNAASKRSRPACIPQEKTAPLQLMVPLPEITNEQACELLQSVDQDIRRVFCKIATHAEQMQFLAALQLLTQPACTGDAHLRWAELVARYR